MKILKTDRGPAVLLSLLLAVAPLSFSAALAQEKGLEEKPAHEQSAHDKSAHESGAAKAPASHEHAAATHEHTTAQHTASKEHHAGKEKLEPVTAKIKISAPPNVVWNVVHEERKHDPDLAYSKVISEGNNEFLLEQKFCLIPVIGTSVCQMHQKETPDQRIDYKLIKSDRFKVMEGSWVLIPSADKLSTTLELTTTLDLGLPVPHSMMNHVTQKKLERRLHHIKEMAEKECHHGSLVETRKDVI